MFKTTIIFTLQECINQIISPSSTNSIKKAQHTLSQLRQHPQYISLLSQYLTANHSSIITNNHKKLALIELRKMGLNHLLSDKYAWENIIHFYYYQSEQTMGGIVLQLIRSQIRLSIDEQIMLNSDYNTQMQCQILECSTDIHGIVHSFINIIFTEPIWGFSQTTKLLQLLSALIQSLKNYAIQKTIKIAQYIFQRSLKIYKIISQQFGLVYQEWFFIQITLLHCYCGDLLLEYRQEFYRQVSRNVPQQNGSLYMKIVINMMMGYNIQQTINELFPEVLKILLQTLKKFRLTNSRKQDRVNLQALQVLNNLIIPQNCIKFNMRTCKQISSILFTNVQNYTIIKNLFNIFCDYILVTEPQSVTFTITKSNNQNQQSEHHTKQNQSNTNIIYQILRAIFHHHCHFIYEQIIDHKQLQYLPILTIIDHQSQPYQLKIVTCIISTLKLILHHNKYITPQLLILMLKYLSNHLQIISDISYNPQIQQQPILSLMYSLLQVPTIPNICKSVYSKSIVQFMNSIVSYVVSVLTLDKIEGLYSYSMGTLRGDPMAITVDSFYVPLILMQQILQLMGTIDGETQIWMMFCQLVQFFEEQPTNCINFELAYIIGKISAHLLMKSYSISIDMAIIKISKYFIKNSLFSVETGIVYGQSLVINNNYVSQLQNIGQIKDGLWQSSPQIQDIVMSMSCCYTIMIKIPKLIKQYQQKIINNLYSYCESNLDSTELKRIIKDLNTLQYYLQGNNLGLSISKIIISLSKLQSK